MPTNTFVESKERNVQGYYHSRKCLGPNARAGLFVVIQFAPTVIHGNRNYIRARGVVNNFLNAIHIQVL